MGIHLFVFLIMGYKVGLSSYLCFFMRVCVWVQYGDGRSWLGRGKTILKDVEVK